METIMLKPPAPTIPGMTDSLEFVKNLWGSMNVPGMGVPGMGASPLSTDELDKKIADLKAVESWLNLNTTMLRGTIHALEVQRGTIATLKTMSASMAQVMGQGGEQAAAPFAQFFGQPQAGAQAGNQSKPQQAQSQQGQSQQTQSQQTAQGGASQGAATPPAAAALPAAVAWWNLLQDQFNQAVASAMSPEAMAGAAAMAQNAARFATAGMPAAAKPDTQSTSGTDNGDASGAAKPRPGKPGNDKS